MNKKILILFIGMLLVLPVASALTLEEFQIGCGNIFQMSCDESQFDTYNNLIASGENKTKETTIEGDLIVNGYINADDVIIHSRGFRVLNMSQVRTNIETLSNLENGEINKSSIDIYYLTEDRLGVMMWLFLMDNFVNLANNIFIWHDEVNARLDESEAKLEVAETRVVTLETELCTFRGTFSFC